MPTDERVQAAVIEISEQLTAIGAEVDDAFGPANLDGEEVPQEEIEELDEQLQYYLSGNLNGNYFYLTFPLEYDYAVIVYPMDVLKYLGLQLSNEEIEQVVEESIEWEELSPEVKDQVYASAGSVIAENTDQVEFQRGSFELSIYGSNPLVSYRERVTENGFPAEFQCVRGLFPYTESVSASELDNRLTSVVNTGNQARRYVHYSFSIDKDNKQPSEYEIRHLQ